MSTNAADDTDITDLPTFSRVSPVSADLAPWSSLHCREAFVRLCELSIELVRAGICEPAVWLVERAADFDDRFTAHESGFRTALQCALVVAFDVARIDAEVALVRSRAGDPPHSDAGVRFERRRDQGGAANRCEWWCGRERCWLTAGHAGGWEFLGLEGR
jgi:hypothetical protein